MPYLTTKVGRGYLQPDWIAHITLVDFVVHTASSMDPTLADHLIKALGQRRKASGADTCFIHVSSPR